MERDKVHMKKVPLYEITSSELCHKKLLIYLTIVGISIVSTTNYGISQHQIEDNVSYVRRKMNK